MLTAALSLFLAVSASADKAQPETKKEETKEIKNQTVCPVMGGKIDSTVYTDIQGQRVYHCCPMCSKNLKADPDKYFMKAAEEGVLFENIQTTCPVSGEELKEKKVFTDHKGRRIYFCCEKCISAFEKNPEKHLSIMDKPSEKKESSKQGHSNHKH